MNPQFADWMKALQETGEGLVLAARGLTAAVEGIKRAAVAAQAVQAEHEDLRETVQRLEGLVLEILRRQNGSDPR